MCRKPAVVVPLRCLDMTLSGADVRAGTRNLVVPKMHGDAAVVQYSPLEFLRRRLECVPCVIKVHRHRLVSVAITVDATRLQRALRERRQRRHVVGPGATHLREHESSLRRNEGLGVWYDRTGYRAY